MPLAKPDQRTERVRHELGALSHVLNRTSSGNQAKTNPTSKSSVSRIRRHQNKQQQQQEQLRNREDSYDRSLASRRRPSSKPIDPAEKRFLSASSIPISSDRQLLRSQSLQKEDCKASDQRGSDKEEDQGLRKDLSQEEDKEKEKKSFWDWRPFHPMSHMAHQGFHVIFSLHVQRIEGLPASMNGLRLAVSWNRKEEGLQTMPVKVLEGMVEFDETLRQRCTIYGTKISGQGIKYEPKLFTLSVVALDVDELELGKHDVELSHLLPQDNDVGPATKWSTNIMLTGAAKGGKLIVAFSYDLVHHESNDYIDEHLGMSSIESKWSPLLSNSLPNSAHRSPLTFPLNPEASQAYLELGTNPGSFVVEHLGLDDQDSAGQSLSISSIGDVENEVSLTTSFSRTHGFFGFKPTLKYFPQGEGGEDFTFGSTQLLDHEDDTNGLLSVMQTENLTSIPYNERYSGKGRSEEYMDDNHITSVLEIDLDDEVDLVADEFLDMLDIGSNSGVSNTESEPNSPRARLLKQFEQDGLLGGGTGLPFSGTSLIAGGGNGQEKSVAGSHSSILELEDSHSSWGLGDGLQLAEIMEVAESELQKATQTMRSKSRAKALEDEETQALLQEWGLSEKSFASSPPKGNLLAPEPPPLGRGLGAVVDLKDGGSLRSMSPSHFPKNRTRGSLVLQASRPVVVPSAMGSSALEILKHLASFGTDNLARQAMAAMPLEDITGKSAEEVAATGMSEMHGLDQLPSQPGSRYQNLTASSCQSGNSNLDQGSRVRKNSSTRRSDAINTVDDYVSLEDIAPLAMQNIEALAINGLKIQADLDEEEAPSYLDAAAWGIVDDLKKQERGNIGTSQGVAGMHLNTPETGGCLLSEAKHDDLLSMSITLEQWTKLDAGLIDDSESNEKTLAVLAAHKAHQVDWAESKRGHSKREGIMGNTLMIAMLVQLRDPLQNFEPVGAPMMALIQAERVMMPPKPKIWKRVSTKGNSEKDDDDEAKEVPAVKVDTTQFKITGVHMSGLKTGDEDVKSGREEETQRKGWGNQKQLQSGSRWLIAQGMGKTSKHSLLKSKPAATQSKVKSSEAQTKVKPGETLWSISSRVLGSGQKWRDLAKLNPHIRNPDIILPNDTLRTR